MSGTAPAQAAASAALAGAGAATPPLFTQTNVRKPEYWQFARLIAPAARLPEGKKAWTTHDATGIWCLRCAKSLNYQKGSSQSIRYHMETRHFEELTRFREQIKRAKAAASSVSSAGPKRKFNELRESDGSPLASLAPAPLPLASAHRAAPVRVAPPPPPEAVPVQIPVPVAPPRPTEPTPMPTRTLASIPTPASIPTSTSTPTSLSNPTPAPTVNESWSRNLERRGGFWGNAYWYDLQLHRRLPLAERTVEELVLALPPCDGKRVLDVCAGSGRASAALLHAYPTARVVLLDTSSERLGIASRRLAAAGLSGQFETVARAVDAADASAPPLLPRPVDVVIGCLAFHVLVERPPHYTRGSAPPSRPAVAEHYERIFRSVWSSLKPGGHVVFGDHVGQLPLFEQLQALARVGFVDVDCAWRQDDSFVAGARKPAH